MQVALRVAAHQLAVLRECDVALDDARAHARRGLVGLLGVLGELERGAAMADGEIGAVERPLLALLQLVLEPPVVDAVDQVERPRAELDAGVALPVVVSIVVAVTIVIVAPVGMGERGEGRESEERCRDGERTECVAHAGLLGRIGESGEACHRAPAGSLCSRRVLGMATG